jgi:anthranilate synthase component 2/para-aminobenzoate synthetase component 2
MILLIDNYDSFVYNLARYVGELGRQRRVVRNDAITIDEIAALHPEAIIISPGPCTPDEAGISLAVVRRFAAEIPILGVCLGHQCIGQVFGGRVVRARRPVHGQTSLINHKGRHLFEGLPNPFAAARYHSLIVELPQATELEVSALSDAGEIMAVTHRRWPVFGVQFHPESVLTECGHAQLANFFRLADRAGRSNSVH